MIYEIKQLFFDDGDVSLQKVVDLQNIVYEGKHTFRVEGFRKRYLENPLGRVISFNAFYGEELVAHYACIPYAMNIGGRKSIGLFDMATVTHPDHRGKGLFKKLAQTTYDFAKKQGYEFILGVANANSFPGYMKYFPMTFVGQLEVRMGLGLNILPDASKEYSVYYDKDVFEWRLRCGRANYSREKNAVLGKYNSMVQTYMGCYSDEFLSSIDIANKHWCFRPRLYVGMGAKFKSLYLKVPKFIKRSPFNVIFLDLTDGQLPPITKENLFFQLIDFDVA